MRVAVVGSINYPDLEEVRKYVRSLPKGTVVVSGGAHGVDSAAKDEADMLGMETRIFPADWDKYGRAAGPIRNKLIVNNADVVVAFWDTNSRGTLNSFTYAIEQKKPTIIFRRVNAQSSTQVTTHNWKEEDSVSR